MADHTTAIHATAADVDTDEVAEKLAEAEKVAREGGIIYSWTYMDTVRAEGKVRRAITVEYTPFAEDV